MKSAHYKLEGIALELFCIVHGQHARQEFLCQNPAILDGWMALARQWTAIKKRTPGFGDWLMKQTKTSK